MFHMPFIPVCADSQPAYRESTHWIDMDPVSQTALKAGLPAK